MMHKKGIKYFITCLKSNGLIYAIKQKNNKMKYKKNYNYYSNLDSKYYADELKEWYYTRAHERLSLKNPHNFNQKIQWIKINDSTEEKRLLSDKYLMKEWVKDNLGEKYVVKLLGVWNSFDEIDFNKLPNQFVLKCNHGSGYNMIVLDKNSFNIDEAKKKFDKWMQTDFPFVAGMELHYKGIERKIICEEYLQDGLIDLQAWCTNGEILFLSYINSPHGENTKRSYNEKWEPLDFVTSPPILESEVKKPKHLKEILEISKKVSKNFKFIRVDFYITSKGDIYISEFTFTPSTGLISWSPKEMNKIMGDRIKL